MSMLYVIKPRGPTNVPASLDTLETAKNAMVTIEKMLSLLLCYLIAL